MSLKRKFAEFYSRLKFSFKEGSLVIPEKTYSGIVYPEPSFSDMYEVQMGDPDISSSIDFIADVAVGNGFQTTMNKNYTETTKDGRTAKEIVDDYCRIFGMDELCQEIACDVIGYGNCFLWVKNKKKIEEIMRILPGTITSFKFDNTGINLAEIKTSYGTFSADEVVHFSFKRRGKTALGVGILQALCSGLGERPSFAEIKNRIQKAMMEQIEKFSAYNELWIIPGVSDVKLAEYSAKIKQLKNERLAFNRPDARVIQIVPERMRGLDFYAETLWNSFYLALATPYPKLILGGGAGFTEAAANAAVTMGERRISALQRYLKRVAEMQIFDVWVAQEGLDPVQAQVRLNWQIVEKPKMESLLPLLARTWELGGLTLTEWRKILIGIGVNLETAEKPEAQLPTVPLTPPPAAARQPQKFRWEM